MLSHPKQVCRQDVEAAQEAEQKSEPVPTKTNAEVLEKAQNSLASAAESIAEGLIMTALLEQKSTAEQKAVKVKQYMDRVTAQETSLKRPVRVHEAVLKQASALLLNGH